MINMATVPETKSMNEASERDPYNNNSYGTLVDAGYKQVNLPILDVNDFNERIIHAYEDGTAEKGLPADLTVSRSLVPAGTATLRDFSYVAPEIPVFINDNCTGCMDCVTLCPDTAILGKVVGEEDFEKRLQNIENEEDRELFRKMAWAEPNKYYAGPKKKTGEGGKFSIIIDPSKCKGCAECVTVCDDDALKMIKKTDQNMPVFQKKWDHFKSVGPTPKDYIMEKVLADMMLAFPGILLAVVLAGFFGGGLLPMLIGINLTLWPQFARMSRAIALGTLQESHVEAAQLAGFPARTILTRHVLPPVLTQVLPLATLGLGTAVMSISALGFLGLGLQPPTPEWGAMISIGR
ncbi:MAG: ABC transporter permease subunit, partial [Planctomycetes bacterium]|nr:ABC transporter permease subunit [Planctomycetota bacterium]